MPTPKPGAGQILVKVAAAGVNRPDVMQRAGAYRLEPNTVVMQALSLGGGLTARIVPDTVVTSLGLRLRSGVSWLRSSWREGR